MGAAASSALLLLADGRFPAGGHAHSAGMEAAVSDGRVTGVGTLEEFVRGRLWTAGLTEAALAAATVERVGAFSAQDPDLGVEAAGVLRALDAEADARFNPLPLRSSSRRLGRQLVRAARRCWPAPVLDAAQAIHPVGPHQPVALGAAAVAAGIGVADAAALAVHHAMTTPAQAALRLLGLDPFDVAAVVAGLAGDAHSVVEEAVRAATRPLRHLPCRIGPLVEIAAMDHAGNDRRLFVT